MQAGFIWSKN